MRTGWPALLREEGGVEGDDRGVLLLAAEAAAGDGLGDVDAIGREIEGLDEGLVDVEGALDRARGVGACSSHHATTPWGSM
jgi:hypothetical protein